MTTTRRQMQRTCCFTSAYDFQNFSWLTMMRRRLRVSQESPESQGHHAHEHVVTRGMSATALLRLSFRPHQPATEGLVRRRFAWHRCCCALGAPTGKRFGAARKFESSQTDETHTVEGGPSSRAGQKAEGVAQDGGGEQQSGAAFRADAVMILRLARPLTLLSLSLPLSRSQ